MQATVKMEIYFLAPEIQFWYMKVYSQFQKMYIYIYISFNFIIYNNIYLTYAKFWHET